VAAARWLLRREADIYQQFRRALGRSIHLLVAADIIRTVAPRRRWAASRCWP
jgi:hypothetical protein